MCGTSVNEKILILHRISALQVLNTRYPAICLSLRQPTALLNHKHEFGEKMPSLIIGQPQGLYPSFGVRAKHTAEGQISISWLQLKHGLLFC